MLSSARLRYMVRKKNKTNPQENLLIRSYTKTLASKMKKNLIQHTRLLMNQNLLKETKILV